MMIIIIKGFWDSLVSTKAIWLGHMPYEFGMGLAAYHAKPMENDGKLMSNLNHQAIVDWVGGPNCHLLFFLAVTASIPASVNPVTVHE